MVSNVLAAHARNRRGEHGVKAHKVMLSVRELAKATLIIICYTHPIEALRLSRVFPT